MPSKEYYEGRDMEKNSVLHSYLIGVFNFDFVRSDGKNSTKGDLIAEKNNEKIPLSLKNVSGKNTQVHLTTLKKLSKDLNIPEEIKKSLHFWFGTNSVQEFNSWLEGIELTEYEKDHKRLASKNIKNWNEVEDWFNVNNKNYSVPKLLIESLKKDSESKILLWFNKKSKVFQAVDIPKLIDFIGSHCKWVTMPTGTILRCITPDNKPILWLQMKGNRTDDGYNHSPQFHIVENWPENVVLHKNVVEIL